MATQTKTLNFAPFKAAIQAQVARMFKLPLFRTATQKDMVWAGYLMSFPEGTDPIYKEKTEHDCNCCKSFVRRMGNVVAIDPSGQVVSLWDIRNTPQAAGVDEAYLVVCDALSQLVKADKIVDVFLADEPTAGTDQNFQQLVNEVKTWDHFYVQLPAAFVTAGSVGEALNGPRTTHDVMLRALTELTADSTNTVLELIAQNSLYRGEEHKFVLTEFAKLQALFGQLATPEAQDLFVWSRVKSIPGSVSGIRNTSIGQLLIDLSTGVDLESAVKKFEAMVAPTNYKRPTALVTPKMIELAKQTIEEQGLLPALQRRYAKLPDISINDVLFADRTTRTVLTGNIFDELAATQPATPKNLDRVEEITIEKFLADVVPKAESIEALFENQHRSNLVSLITADNPTAKPLFKWNNPFSWAYAGEVADAIKERVKAAGGNITGDLCCRLAWYNTDDLDFHMKEPGGGHIYYGNKGQLSGCGGMLDVDMNAGNLTRTPVENIVYKDRNRMKEGVYELIVNNFNRRERKDEGFEVQFDFLGTVYTFAYSQGVAQSQNITVIKFKYSKAGGIEVLESLPHSQSVQNSWGLATQQFHPVNVIALSPNFWDGAGNIGNKHYMFFLAGCANEDQARGFFNEFLRPDLDVHRKALELVGSKLKTTTASEQLSGLGFSSTARNHLIVKVKGTFNRTLKVTF